MNIRLEPLASGDVERFSTRMQEAFQLAVDAADEQHPLPVLPREDIDEALADPRAVPLVAWCGDEAVGGTVVNYDPQSAENECALLYIDPDHQGRGVGSSLWKAIENYFPDTRAWTLCTPYFEKRNIIFYLRKCGFHIVDLYEDDVLSSRSEQNKPELMFSFIKRMDGNWG